MLEIHSSAVIITYEDLFQEAAPKSQEERLEIIKDIPKVELLHEIASLNYRLRPYNNFSYNSEDETQITDKGTGIFLWWKSSTFSFLF
jgi:hypothetical protein